jgi:hypothetical protein
MNTYLFANTMEFGQEKVKGSQKDSKQVFEWSSKPKSNLVFFFHQFSHVAPKVTINHQRN